MLFQCHFSQLMPTASTNGTHSRLVFKSTTKIGSSGLRSLHHTQALWYLWSVLLSTLSILRTWFSLHTTPSNWASSPWSFPYVLDLFSSRAPARLDHSLFLIWASSFRNGYYRGLITLDSSLPEISVFTIYKQPWKYPCCKEIYLSCLTSTHSTSEGFFDTIYPAYCFLQQLLN